MLCFVLYAFIIQKVSSSCLSKTTILGFLIFIYIFLFCNSLQNLCLKKNLKKQFSRVSDCSKVANHEKIKIWSGRSWVIIRDVQLKSWTRVRASIHRLIIYWKLSMWIIFRQMLFLWHGCENSHRITVLL